MKRSTLSRYALSISIAAAAVLLAGCGGSQPPIGAPGAMPQTSALATHADRGTSWMAPDAREKDLLYVTNSNTVTAYSYSDGDLEGTLISGNEPMGDCVDAKGDIWIVTAGGEIGDDYIVEYAHGGKNPIAILRSPNVAPVGCAIDPTTGNLAVATQGVHGSGSVAIFPNASGRPTQYTNSNTSAYTWLSYDKEGDLFANGLSLVDHFALTELPKGGSSLETITLNQNISPPGGIQAVRNVVVIGNHDSPVVDTFGIHGSRGSMKDLTDLSGATDVSEFLIVGNTIIAPNACAYPCTGQVLYYPWPEGGTATMTITNGVDDPHSVALSKAAP